MSGALTNVSYPLSFFNVSASSKVVYFLFHIFSIKSNQILASELMCNCINGQLIPYLFSLFIILSWSFKSIRSSIFLSFCFGSICDFLTTDMALSSSFAFPQICPKIDCRVLVHKNRRKAGISSILVASLQGLGTEQFGKKVPKLRTKVKHDWCFLGGHRLNIRPTMNKFVLSRKSSGVCYSWLANTQIASSAFTWGTAAVLPFYTLMVVAPKAELTKTAMRSSIPYVVLGVLYAYLLFLSWTPETIRLMFASKYWLPELQGIAKMFSSEMTLASAWIHLLVVDLYAARQVYEDGLEKEIETRHSVSMCLLFCPIGIISHLITKALTRPAEKTRHTDNIS